jgi:hypothetical protein
MRLVAAALLVLLAACGGEDETECTVQNLTITCCQPPNGAALCFVSGDDPACRETVIKSASWIGTCP